jgi:hypothetical protein
LQKRNCNRSEKKQHTGSFCKKGNYNRSEKQTKTKDKSGRKMISLRGPPRPSWLRLFAFLGLLSVAIAQFGPLDLDSPGMTAKTEQQLEKQTQPQVIASVSLADREAARDQEDNEGGANDENDPAEPTSQEVDACCAACGVDFSGSVGAGKVIRILSFDTGLDLMNMQKSAAAFEEKTGIKVLFDLIPDFNGLYAEIRSQAEQGVPLYDGYISGPAIVGSAVQLDGFLDFTNIVRDRQDLKWLDVLRGFRENIAVYDKKVRMLPLDGDAHFLYYRKDVLDAFNLTVPRTWDEYWQVAKAVHGKEFNGQTMVGSCVGRKSGAHTSYWASLVLSSYTQTKGRTEGFILDSKDMTPLAGEAMAEAIKQLELQAKYGHPRGKV